MVEKTDNHRKREQNEGKIRCFAHRASSGTSRYKFLAGLAKNYRISCDLVGLKSWLNRWFLTEFQMTVRRIQSQPKLKLERKGSMGKRLSLIPKY